MVIPLQLVFLLLSIDVAYSAALSNLKVLSDEEMRVMRTLRFYDHLTEEDAAAKYCPVSHPFAYYGGAHCCATGYEKYYSGDGRNCDNSEISLSSTCCSGDNHTPCPSGKNCQTRPAEKFCPFTHPYAYYRGSYCCKHEYEKQYGKQGLYCNGGRINFNSRCCEGDDYVKCPSGICRMENGDCFRNCGNNYWPVCGGNGKTYPNECQLLKEVCLKGNSNYVAYRQACRKT